MSQMTVKLYASAISCESCVAAIVSGLQGMPGVNNVSIDLESKMVTVDYNADNTSESDIRRRMKDIGYAVIG
jgi:copper chaperone CopZ